MQYFGRRLNIILLALDLCRMAEHIHDWKVKVQFFRQFDDGTTTMVSAIMQCTACHDVIEIKNEKKWQEWKEASGATSTSMI
ncbi:MAG: hypothetical protein ABI348_06785 [Nitrososphaera sp.]